MFANACVECNNTWKVIITHRLKLDEFDKENLDKYGRLYSVCENCSEYGECESVIMDE